MTALGLGLVFSVIRLHLACLGNIIEHLPLTHALLAFFSRL